MNEMRVFSSSYLALSECRLDAPGRRRPKPADVTALLLPDLRIEGDKLFDEMADITCGSNSVTWPDRVVTTDSGTKIMAVGSTTDPDAAQIAAVAVVDEKTKDITVCAFVEQLPGAAIEIILRDKAPTDNHVTGEISFACGAAPESYFECFMPFYLAEDEKLVPGRKLCLSLAGIGFEVRRIDGEEPVTAGPLFESLQKQWLRDNPDKKPADFSLVLQPSDCFLASPSYETTSCVTVRQPLLAVEKIEIAGHGFYKVLYALAGFAEDDVRYLVLPVYVPETAFAEEPRAGESFEMSVMLTGYLRDPATLKPQECLCLRIS